MQLAKCTVWVSTSFTLTATMKSKNNHFHPYHRQPKLCGSSLDFEFIRECLKINKIRPKFQFWTKIEIKMTYLVFVFYCLFASRAIWKPFYRRLRFWVVLNVRKLERLGTLKPTVPARSSINPIKMVTVLLAMTLAMHCARPWTEANYGCNISFERTLITSHPRARSYASRERKLWWKRFKIKRFVSGCDEIWTPEA